MAQEDAQPGFQLLKSNVPPERTLAPIEGTDELGAQDTAERVKPASRRATVRQLYVRDEASVAALFDAVGRELGAIDILVNNAGVGAGARAWPICPWKSSTA
jgi:NAD(P)-dependent dehydrogenase (short-subunit alcohol dehydrogenase family)